MMYSVLIIGRETRTNTRSRDIIVNDGELFHVLNEEWGPTSVMHKKAEKLPAALLTWETAKEAEEFAKSWRGHPWWCKPKSYRVIKLVPHMEPNGWDIVEERK